jgi:MerR family transcriptional regulator/heat shock protein HspR
MASQGQFREEPCFVISVAARIVGVHAQTLRYYERVGLIWPSRTVGRQRLYSMADIERVQRVKALTDEMGVNLEKQVQGLTEELYRLRAQQNAPANRPRSDSQPRR